VDFNVHPSKLEVKLLRERAVYATVQRALRGALAHGQWPIATWGDGQTRGRGDAETAGRRERESGEAETRRDGEAGDDLLAGGERLEELRVLGQVGRTYLIAEGDAGLYLVDQHAAHERVLLEELRAALAGRAERQLLLEPAVVDVPTEAASVVEQSTSELAQLGFDLESFGPRQLLVRAVPALVAARQPGRVLAESLAAVAGNSHGLVFEPHTTWAERLALVLACKTAVRAGDSLSEVEMEALLRRLGEAALCRTCAHGRPTAILLSHAQLAREFGRR
jgi:DNA mismatch repair protein MutL